MADRARACAAEGACAGGAHAGRVGGLLGEMSGTAQLVARCSMEPVCACLEGLRLRVKDLDFETGEVVVRGGEGKQGSDDDAAASVIGGLQRHMERVRALHDRDVSEGFGRVWLPTRSR